MRAIDIRLPAAVALALTLAGCGLTDPYASQHRRPTQTSMSTTATTTTVTTTDEDPVPERGGTIPKAAQVAQNHLAAAAGSPTPQAALERYARLDINWSAKTVAGVQDQLAAISVGQARALALQAASSYGHDRTLLASQVANRGIVVAMAPGQGSAAGWWVVVTRETTTGQGDYAGLPPTDHVTNARVEETPSGWVVSAWSPQS